ncbi:N-acetylmuramoyl-L-alanine amidase [bacterium]|nr:N-acetylmuramoyl-L-alanine amidase [bacterium]
MKFLWSLTFFCPLKVLALVVAIDAGHGGTDNGATHAGIRESAVVLGISQQLEKILNQDPDYQAFLTRADNSQVELHQRVKKAQKNNAQLFVSIHANSSPDPHSQGMEIYFRNELPPNEESLKLAHNENQSEMHKKRKNKGDVSSILNDMLKSMNTLKSYELSWHIVDHWKVPFSKKRLDPIKQGPFYVIHQDHIPSILVEIGFITNEKESKRLNTPSYQKDIAQAIYKGLKDYKETLDKGHSKALK